LAELDKRVCRHRIAGQLPADAPIASNIRICLAHQIHQFEDYHQVKTPPSQIDPRNNASRNSLDAIGEPMADYFANQALEPIRFGKPPFTAQLQRLLQ
jgi:hypothetical protein